MDCHLYTRDEGKGRPEEIGIFLAGDFNSLPNQEAYLEMKQSNLMSDLGQCVRPGKRYGNETIFTGFNKDKDPEDQGRIDFTWLGPKETVADQVVYQEHVPNCVLPRHGLW